MKPLSRPPHGIGMLLHVGRLGGPRALFMVIGLAIVDQPDSLAAHLSQIGVMNIAIPSFGKAAEFKDISTRWFVVGEEIDEGKDHLHPRIEAGDPEIQSFSLMIV